VSPDGGVYEAGTPAGTLASVPIVRAYHPSTGEHFYTVDADEATRAGFTIEYNPYFYLATDVGPAGTLVALNRCYLNYGKHFYTTSSNCEGAAATPEGHLGYLSASATCGAVPLHRLNAPRRGDHLYTVDAAEIDRAHGLGYQDEGVIGFVWTTPTIQCP
jgi:hypothetical protein